jgi:hypothetical protein
MTAIPLGDDPSSRGPAATAESGAALPYAAATPDRAGARQARLTASVARLRRRSSGLEMDRILLLAGSILLPSGLIVILLGWYGASHTSYDFEQTPYLISGGMLGVAMTIAGGFLYFGYWLTKLVQEGRRERVELSELLSRIDTRMAVLEAASAQGTSVEGTPVAGAQRRPFAASGLVATATGTLVHRADCGLVRDKPGLRSVDASEPGLRPCKVCQPFSDGGLS